MKVFILVIEGADYGAQLRNYALFKAIEEIGHEPICIAWRQNYINSRICPFKKFSNQYLNLYKSHYLQKDLCNHILDDSMVILSVRSNFNRSCWLKSPEQPFLRYFGDFISGSKILVSISSHFALLDIPLSISRDFKGLLQRFDGLSVDSNAEAEFINKHFSINAKVLLDPIFMLSSDSYDQLFDGESVSLPFDGVPFIAYMVVDDIWGLNISKLSLGSKKIFNINTLEDGLNFNDVSTWLFYIKKSEMVISDCFYCIAFAIIFNIPFVALVNSNDDNNAIIALLKKLNLQHLIKSTLLEIDGLDLKSSINWEAINTIIHDGGLAYYSFLRSSFNINPKLKYIYKNKKLEHIRHKKEMVYIKQIFPIDEYTVQKKRIETKRRFFRILLKILVDKRKYKKLKRDYKQFFSDSQSQIIRLIGKYYLKDSYSEKLAVKERFMIKGEDNENAISLHFWNWKRNNKYNVGDLLSTYIVEKISNRRVVWTSAETPNKLCAVGSLISEKMLLSGGHFWGSGCRVLTNNRNMLVYNKPVKFYSVRGPITRDFVLSRGFECPEIYGDPALLLPEFYPRRNTKKYKLGLVCHINHRFLLNYDEGIYFIDILRSSDNMLSIVDDICKCESILSSSLHGIIIANAYGIPARWFTVKGFALEPYVKYHDYFLSVKMPIQEPLIFNEDTFITQDIIKSTDKTVDLKINLNRLKDSFPYDLCNS